MLSLMMCDDHVMLRDMILGVLEKEHEFAVCGRTESGEDCIHQIEQGIIPDLLILDISLPEMPGYEVARYLREKFPQIKILVFSIITDYAAVKAMIRFGVDGFAFKDITPPVIASIIHSIMAGEAYYPPDFMFTAQEIEAIKTTAIPWVENITQREMTAVKLLAKDLSRKQVAYQMGISPSVVNKKIDNIFKKTGHRTTLSVVDFLKRVGIIS